MKLDAVAPTLAGRPAAAAEAAARKAPPSDPRLAKAARDLEGIFVRQLVAAAKLGGKSAESGYGAMAADALSTGIQAGGGLGLARRIEEALSASLRPVAPAASALAAPLATSAPLSGAPR